MSKRLLSILLACAGIIVALTMISVIGVSADTPLVWRNINEQTLALRGERQIIPQAYRLVTTDQAALATILDSAPLEWSDDAAQRTVVLPLPLPSGAIGRFSIVESPIMEPGLAEKFPTIKTYTGQGLDDSSATVRLDRTPAGFHALILSNGDSVYIDPYSTGQPEYLISYFERDFTPSVERWQARAANEIVDPAKDTGAAQGDQTLQPSGSILRTYRLAMAATGEYTQFHGGTKPLALAAIVTSVNRVNAVYEREVAIRMILIANNDLIVYTAAASDPYDNTNGVTMLGQNQTNLTSVIGSANYDIGHVFSTGGGGVATLNSPCNATTKARGVTGSGSPVGDPFDIDYVAHEIGHQFGGLHTFNGTTSSCGGGNRSSSAAYEPGSGSTIMAYAGICGAENLQPNSDPYFHSKSYEQITTFTTTGGGNACAVQVNTGNSAPTVSAGASFTIPANTPFNLTGSGSDPDGDALTYNWEEYDLGAAAPPNTDNGNRPIFRSFNASSSPTRTFPKLADILSNTASFGESLPTTNRTMNFRLTVRDNRAGGGGVNFATTSVTVNNSAGPFAVTAPNTAVNWVGNTSETVTWNVANTTAAPVSCPSVSVKLSTDGGLTFPSTLLASTPNDGTQSITVPNIGTTMARIKVECANNIFFDISNANFTITLSGGATATPVTPTATGTPVTPTATATATPPIGSCTLNEGFDNVAGLVAAGWSLQNLSNPAGTSTWFQGNPGVFPAFSGATNSYIGANFNATTGANTISNWLLTPVQALANGATFSFQTRIPTVAGTEFPDRLEVRLSTAGSSTNVGATNASVGDFTTVLLTINPTLVTGVYPQVWTEFTVTISGLAAPTTGRIGFRYFVESGGPGGDNSNYIGLDDVKYCAAVVTPTATPSGPTATPVVILDKKTYLPMILR